MYALRPAAESSSAEDDPKIAIFQGRAKSVAPPDAENMNRREIGELMGV
ncbi:MAG: hypothetical protein AB1646_22360 [Thermodesulfobacteriota bacterium]